MMCNIYRIFIVAVGTILLCCDLTRGYILSEEYLTDTDKTAQDLQDASMVPVLYDSSRVPGLYQFFRRYPAFPEFSQDKTGEPKFEGNVNFSRRGSIRLSVDDTGGFDVSKRMTPPAREWCRIIGYQICRRSYK